MRKRYPEIDAIRGLAVFLMIASHTVWFQGSGDSTIWNFLRSWGDAVCYITFLFVFGITMYINGSRDDSNDNRRGLKRIINLGFIYYLSASVSLLPEIGHGLNLEKIVKTLLLINVPGFTEFLIPFFLYLIIFEVFRKYLTVKKIASIKALIVSLAIYIFGVFLFQWLGAISLPFDLHAYPAMIWGHQRLLRFPLLQYLPVLVLGAYIGRRICENDRPIKECPAIGKSFVVISVFTLLLWSTEILWSLSYFNEYLRWPPSVLFIGFGLSFALFSLLLFGAVQMKHISVFFQTLGKNSLGILAFHIILFRFLSLMDTPKSGNFIILLGLFIMALLGYLLFLSVFRSIKKR